VERYRVEPTLETVSVLVDLAIFSVGQFPLEPQIDQIIMEALTKFPLNYQLLELTGTLRLFQQRYQEAFSLLIRSEKLAPQSVITLNNLAIVASEIPGREQEGLARIEKAIERFGRSPDLLDTLGVVQLTCGLAAQAETNLAASWKEKQDARTLLHLIQSLQAQGKQTELRERLKSLKLSDMRGIVLTTREQKAIESLRQTNPDLLHAEQSL
jgi:tetratricopeptide (TPR) repeat protein